MRKLNSPFVFAFSAIVLMVLAQIISHTNTRSIEQLAGTAGKKIESKLKDCEVGLQVMNRHLPNLSNDSLLDFFENSQIALFRFKNDSLVYWNNSRISPDWKPSDLQKNFGLVKLKQGYCLYSLHKSGNLLDVALCLVQPDYPIRNKYLKNNFQEWTGLYDGIQFSANDSAGTPVILRGEKIFSIASKENTHGTELLYTVCALIFLVGVTLFLFALLKLEYLTGTLRVALVLILLFLIRWVMSVFHWPVFLYKSLLFDVHEFGNANAFLNNYLGDLILNAAFLLFAVLLIRKQFSQSFSRNTVLFFHAVNLVLIGIVFIQFNLIIPSLVKNSTLNFDLLAIFNMKTLSFAALICPASLALALFIGIRSLFKIRHILPVAGTWVYFLSLAGMATLDYLLLSEKPSLLSFWLLAPALVFWILDRLRISNPGYALTAHLLLSSLFASYLFNQSMAVNQESELKLLSFRLSERQDPALENEYLGIEKKIQNDRRLQNLIDLLPNTQKEIPLFLRQKYFGSYFDRYTCDFYLFDKNCMPLIPQSEPVYWNQGYFEEQIKYRSDSSYVPGLFFVEAYKNSSLYLAKVTLGENTLFIRMEAKRLEEQGSFPDLLLDESQQKQEKLGNLSYAIYRSGRLVSHYGDYSYPHFPPEDGMLSSASSTYKHFFFEPEENTSVVMSVKQKTPAEMFTYNSYLFLVFSLFGFVALYLYGWMFSGHTSKATLTQRIQGSIILILLFAMTSVGITSSRLVAIQFENDNRKELSEKSAVLLNELLSQFSPNSLFDGSQKELVNQKLNDYARLFNCDLSLFDSSGHLVNTSQPKLYELGLSAGIMQARAYRDLKLNLAYSSNVRESAGKLSYLSHYIPVFDQQSNLHGFINLPYFARESSLLKELSGIISGLINVYLVLFMISIVTGLLLSGYITRPLRLIKQQIARISLGKRNETIHWPSNDEVGNLVSEYNQMLIKLEESANLLALSERESAWREMAKQVAHEIKNPLTPMKLNLQYLQHLIQSHPEDFKAKFKDVSSGIIEQIDALANIATEFSHLARLPGTSLQSINLVEMIERSVQLFNKQHALTVNHSISEKQIWVMGDKDQCLRVFNNILSNAVQALEETQNPRIEIRAQLLDRVVIIAIQDNGCGISDELKSVMFTPNFTTKNTGSGIGLAMVKNIMQGFGGKVWFESEKNAGSTFFLEFKRAESTQD